jgi:hypothetical protein
MARQKNWSYNSYDEDEDISIIGNYIWDSGSLAWIKQTAAAAGGGGPVTIADGDDFAEGSVADAAWVSGNGTVISILKAIASGGGGLTDAQLRATPVPVSGPLTDIQLRASAVAISGTVSIAGTVPVSGPLTDAQLRAVAVPVSGTFFQATQPVSAASLPLPTGAATEATLGTRLSESDFDSKTGSLTEAAPASDTASSGLNGRLQRIAQRLTSLIGLLPAALVGGRLDVNIGASGATVPVSGTFFQATQPVSIAATVQVDVTDEPARDLGKVDIASLDQYTPVSGRLPVDGSGVTQPVSGTVTANQGTASANDWRTDLRRGQTILFASIDVAASGDNTIVAASPGNKCKVLSYSLVCDGTVATRWKSGAGTNLSGAMSFVANTGIAPPSFAPAEGHLFETAVNTALVLNLSAAIGVRGHMSYILEA